MATQKSQSSGGGGCAGMFIILLLIGAIAYLLYQKYAKPPVTLPPTPTPIQETPTPTPVPTPVETPTPTPTPEATPTPTPTPEATPSLLSYNRKQLPLQVKLIKPTVFPIIANGKRIGQVSVPAGVMLQFLGVKSEELIEVQFQQTKNSIPVNSTDLWEKIRSLGRYGIIAAATPTTAKPNDLKISKPPKTEIRKRASLRPGSLLQEDFDSGDSWRDVNISDVGTIDEAGSKQASLGIITESSVTSGPLAIKNEETNLAKLTLAFSLSASAARPVSVKVESFSQAKIRTGGLETIIYPAAPDFYQRYALDFLDMKPSGDGKFEPDAPYISFTYSTVAADWKEVEKPSIRIDNIHYAKPAFYVSGKGDDNSTGKTEKTAFATPQRALDESGPGDIIVVMNGTYAPQSEGRGVAVFEHTGSPVGWISLKNYPGQQPLFSAIATWNTIGFGAIDKENPSVAPSYLEVRGIHIRGDSDEAKKKYPDSMDQADPRTNCNGIGLDTRKSSVKSHHLRFANNLVEYCTGAGIGTCGGDWLTVENNICRNNCWWMIYGGSGISYLVGDNFDGTENTYRRLIRNNITSGNQTFLKWQKEDRISDGNGIIVDTSENDEGLPPFTGRTLVQSNLTFNNGGSGIHSFRSQRVDIINNTAYLNSASPALQYSQIFAAKSKDVRVINNILVAPIAKGDEPPEKINGAGSDPENDIVFSHNLYFGGNVPPEMGKNDREGNPDFVNPSIDPAVADFHLKKGSPAIGSGHLEDFMPFLDLDGKPRGNDPDKGVYQSTTDKLGTSSLLPR